MGGELERIRKRLYKLDGKRSGLVSLRKAQRKLAREASKRSLAAKEAREFFLKVAQDTQANLETRLSKIVTMALCAVFDDPYEFKVKYEIRRGTTECDLVLYRDGYEYDPLASSGGGVVDITALALRMAVWSLAPDSRPVMILDEPFRNLSENHHELAAEMLHSLSQKLGIQIIMASHNKGIISGADAVFRLAKKGVVERQQ